MCVLDNRPATNTILDVRSKVTRDGKPIDANRFFVAEALL